MSTKNLIFNHRFQCFHSQVSLHLIFGWELPISAVNFGVLGVKTGKAFSDFDPNLISSSDSDPKGSHQIS